MVTGMTPPSLDTLATLRSLVKGTPPLTQEYLDRLAQVLGRQDYKNSLTNRMAVFGFHWSVTLGDLLRGFPYVAALSGVYPADLVGVKNKSTGNVESALIFTGFVPAFALDKILQAQGAGLTKFTIHSNQPLPVEEVMARRDPVVIGWNDWPEIVKEGETFSAKKPDLRGFFITGWDLENEFQLPPSV